MDTPAYENNLPQIDHIFPQSAMKQIKVKNPETGKMNIKYSMAFRNQLANCMLLTRTENGPGGKSDTLPKDWFADKEPDYGCRVSTSLFVEALMARSCIWISSAANLPLPKNQVYRGACGSHTSWLAQKGWMRRTKYLISDVICSVEATSLILSTLKSCYRV